MAGVRGLRLKGGMEGRGVGSSARAARSRRGRGRGQCQAAQCGQLESTWWGVGAPAKRSSPRARRSSLAPPLAASQERRSEKVSDSSTADSVLSQDTRRSALVKLSLSTALLSATMNFPAFKAFAQSVGILETRKAELEEVLSTLQESPKDELALSEKSLLEGQIKSIESNIAYLDKTRPLVEAGEANFLQHAVLEVSDVDRAVKFWTEGLGMKVNRSRSTNGTKQAFVSFGPETFKADNGGMFALELIEKKDSKQDNSGQFFQFALSNSLRVNRLYEAGGEITFGYGYFEIDAPDGYKVVAYIGKRRSLSALPVQRGLHIKSNLIKSSKTEPFFFFFSFLPSAYSILILPDRRRDPFDLIGVYVDDVEAAAAYYQNVFGMKADKAYAKQKVGRFDPVRPEGSVLMTYGDPKDNTSILLVPQKGKKQSIKIAVLDKDVYERKEKLEAAGVTPDFVGAVPGIGTKVALVQPKDGVPIVFVDYQDFEKEQPTPTVLSIKEEIEAFVAMTKELENAETVNLQ